MKRIATVILVFFACIAFLAGCDMMAEVSQGRLYFNDTKDQALLVDESGSLIWLYAEEQGYFESFDSGDLVKVRHGAVMESYPGQTYVTSVELIEDGDLHSFTDAEWERLCAVFVEPPQR